MAQEVKVGELYQNRYTKSISLVIGFLLIKNAVVGVLTPITTLYIDKKFRYNSAVNLALYFGNLRDSVLSEPLKQDNVIFWDCKEYDYQRLDLDMYEIAHDLFTPDAVNNWVVKSIMRGTFSETLYRSQAEAKEAKKKQQLEKQAQKEKEKIEALKGFDTVTPEQLRAGCVYKSVLKDKKYIFIEENENYYVFLELKDGKAKQLNKLNTDTDLYSYLLDVSQCQGAQYCSMSALRDDMVFVKDYGFGLLFNNLNIKLSMKHYV